MDSYSKIIDNIEQYLETEDVFLNPEILLQYHLQKQNMEVNRFKLDYSLLCHNQHLDNKERSINFDVDKYLQTIRVKKLIHNNKFTYQKY